VSAYIFNSDGIQVGVVRGPDMFDLTGKKLYTLKGQYLSPVRRTGRAFERREGL
jgi:hypothetical protein